MGFASRLIIRTTKFKFSNKQITTWMCIHNQHVRRGKWFCLTVSKVGDATFTVAINGYNVGMGVHNYKVTSKQKSLPKWWGGGRSNPSYVLEMPTMQVFRITWTSLPGFSIPTRKANTLHTCLPVFRKAITHNQAVMFGKVYACQSTRRGIYRACGEHND